MAYKTYSNRTAMKADGYVFPDHSSECSKCGAAIEWATTRKGKKVPFNLGSTVCHFETCGQGKADAQKAQPASTERAASPALQELLVALRALNGNVIALDGTVKALLAHLDQRAATDRAGGLWHGNANSDSEARAEKANGGGKETKADMPRTFINDHGLEVSDEDVPF